MPSFWRTIFFHVFQSQTRFFQAKGEQKACVPSLSVEHTRSWKYWLDGLLQTLHGQLFWDSKKNKNYFDDIEILYQIWKLYCCSHLGTNIPNKTSPLVCSSNLFLLKPWLIIPFVRLPSNQTGIRVQTFQAQDPDFI